jgi:hypothetical protein
MSLPRRQQRALNRIEKTLLAGDPRLGSLFAIFARLTWHDVMPRIEQVRPRLRLSLQRSAATAIALIAVLGVLVLSSLLPGRPTCNNSPAVPGRTYSWEHKAACPPRPAIRQDRQSVR